MTVTTLAQPTYRYSPTRGGIIHKTEGFVQERELEGLRKALAKFERSEDLISLEAAIDTMLDYRMR
jgi:hypothetical protein